MSRPAKRLRSASSAMNFDPGRFKRVEVQDHLGGPSEYIVPHRYDIIRYLSFGAQGSVVSAVDKVTMKLVAIKKLHTPLQDEQTAKRTYREFVLLSTMKHDNIIAMVDAYTPQTSAKSFRDLYLVTELKEFNLTQAIKERPFSHFEISYFVYQMLAALHYMHRSGIIHRDLKPSNIVVEHKGCKLKILDFGLARKMPSAEDTKLSLYVVTRWYRAPEIIMGLPYDEKVDVWAIGCIFAELVFRQVLFPGCDQFNQWDLIVSILGSPSSSFLDRLDTSRRSFVQNRGTWPGVPMELLFPDNCIATGNAHIPELNAKNARDLLSKMLQIDPEKRISISEAVEHPYIKVMYDKQDWDLPLPENRYNPEIDLATKTLKQWKESLFKEVKRFEAEHSIAAADGVIKKRPQK